MAEEAKKEKVSFWAGLKSEYKKIIWPTKSNVVKQTLLIIIVTVILGVLVTLLDTGVMYLINLIA